MEKHGNAVVSKFLMFPLKRFMLLSSSLIFLLLLLPVALAQNETLSSNTYVYVYGPVQLDKNVTVKDIGTFDTLGITFARQYNKTGTFMVLKLYNTGSVLLNNVGVQQPLDRPVAIALSQPLPVARDGSIAWVVLRLRRVEAFSINLSANGTGQFAAEPVVTYDASSLQVAVTSNVSRLESIFMTIVSDSQPLENVSVQVIAPNGHTDTYLTDANGSVEFVPIGTGTYTYRLLGLEGAAASMNTQVAPLAVPDLGAGAASAASSLGGNQFVNTLLFAIGAIGFIAILAFAVLLFLGTQGERDKQRKLSYDLTQFQKTPIDIVPIKSEKPKVSDVELAKERERMKGYLQGIKEANVSQTQTKEDETSELIRSRKEKLGLLASGHVYAGKEEQLPPSLDTREAESESVSADAYGVPGPEAVSEPGEEVEAEEQKEGEGDDWRSLESRLQARADAERELQAVLDLGVMPVQKAEGHVVVPEPEIVKKPRPHAAGHKVPERKAKRTPPKSPKVEKAKSKAWEEGLKEGKKLGKQAGKTEGLIEGWEAGRKTAQKKEHEKEKATGRKTKK